MPNGLRRLPLFPLQTVLFPGAPLPLRVFEPRYRRLLQDCLAGDRRFGVCLIAKGWEVGGPALPAAVGTVAEILSVRSRDSGESELLTVGRERFEIRAIVSEEPYLLAEVEGRPEVISEALETGLIEETASLARDYVKQVLAVSAQPHQAAPIPTDPGLLSFFCALILPMPLPERQELLEMDDTGERLHRVHAELQAAKAAFPARRFRPRPDPGIWN